MLKITGSVLIMAAAFALGASRKSRLLRDIETLKLLIGLFSELHYAVNHNAGGMMTALTSLAGAHRYGKLSFLHEGALLAERGQPLGNALAESFEHDARCAALSSEERQICSNALLQLAATARDAQLQILESARNNLERSQQQRQQDSRLSSRYFELLYTLAGAGLVLLLL